MYCYLPVFLCLFESFKRDLNEAKAVYISNIISSAALYLRLKFPLRTALRGNRSVTFSIIFEVSKCKSSSLHSNPL